VKVHTIAGDPGVIDQNFDIATEIGADFLHAFGTLIEIGYAPFIYFDARFPVRISSPLRRWQHN
jgi:hypothetical protein